MLEWGWFMGLFFAFAKNNFDLNAISTGHSETSLDTFRDELYYHNSILLFIPLKLLRSKTYFRPWYERSRLRGVLPSTSVIFCGDLV